MPPITVSMIEEKDFTIAFRGYAKVEVDEFLDDICDEMIALQEEIGTLQTKLAQAQRAPTQPYQPAMMYQQSVPYAPKPPEKPVQAEPSEAVQKLLANTQRICDETLADAKRQAEEIIANAKSSVAVNPVIEDLSAEKERLENDIADLKSAANDYRMRFRALVEAQTRILEDSEDVL